jgi:hypothetical protein
MRERSVKVGASFRCCARASVSTKVGAWFTADRGRWQQKWTGKSEWTAEKTLEVLRDGLRTGANSGGLAYKAEKNLRLFMRARITAASQVATPIPLDEESVRQTIKRLIQHEARTSGSSKRESYLAALTESVMQEPEIRTLFENNHSPRKPESEQLRDAENVRLSVLRLARYLENTSDDEDGEEA